MQQRMQNATNGTTKQQLNNSSLERVKHQNIT